MGVYLSQPYTDKETQEGKQGNLQYVASSMQGWRTNMEDAHIMEGNLDEDTAIFGVFDGHGGKEVAIFVEKHFIEELKKNENYLKKNYKEALYENFLKMDDLLNSDKGKEELNFIKSGEKDSGYQADSYAGCTANVSLLHKKTLYCANAGDSRSVLSRKGGEMLELSFDHKPEQEQERERVRKAGGFVSDGRINGNLNLSRAIGDLEYKKNQDMKVNEQLIIACPDITVTELEDSDEFILMGCDGIWETKTNQELVTYCRDKLMKQETHKQVIEDLLDMILAPDTQNGYGCDNMTSIIITLREPKTF